MTNSRRVSPRSNAVRRKELREEEGKSRKRQKPQDQITAAQTNGRPTWSGTISFGLVSIPVNLFPATRDSRVALRTFGPDGEPPERDFYAPETGLDLEKEETVRGYEAKPEFVTITEEELERLAPEKSRDINLRVFVARSEISPMYFERAYILTPADKSGKAYRLLAEIMEYSQRVGIATFVMLGKEYLVAILARGGILRAEMMRFGDEVRRPFDIVLPKRKRPSSTAVEKFHKTIERLAKNTLDLDEVRDKYAERMLKFIQKKRARVRNVRNDSLRKGPAEIVDLSEVLKRNVIQDQVPKSE
jgi:DNA end-binding protein Ku